QSCVRSTVLMSSLIKLPVYIFISSRPTTARILRILFCCLCCFVILVTSKLFPPPASLRCVPADCDQSLLRCRSAVFSSATRTGPALLPRASHLSQCGLPASES